MRIHIFQHVDFEDEGSIADFAKNHNYHVGRTLFYKGEKLPDLKSFDFLVIMGGSMNIYEEDRYPFLNEEKKFIKSSIEVGKKIVGICLGAQLLSDVLGGKVYKNDEKEIGWQDVKLTGRGRESRLFGGFPDQFKAFHWHGDTFSIPPGAIHLAKSSACENQAFSYQDRIIGLQFHLESTEMSIQKLLENGKGELRPGKFIQKPEEIINTGFTGSLNRLMDQLFKNIQL